MKKEVRPHQLRADILGAVLLLTVIGIVVALGAMIYEVVGRVNRSLDGDARAMPAPYRPSTVELVSPKWPGGTLTGTGSAGDPLVFTPDVADELSERVIARFPAEQWTPPSFSPVRSTRVRVTATGRVGTIVAAEPEPVGADAVRRAQPDAWARIYGRAGEVIVALDPSGHLGGERVSLPASQLERLNE